MRARFWELPLASLDREEWEALCDGCGKCCLHKLEDEETGELHADQRRLPPARPAQLPLLQLQAAPRLRARLRAARRDRHAARSTGCPSTCAYRLRGEGKPLADWHYLISGDRETVHEAGMSVRGWTVSEDEAGDLEHHLVDRAL